VTKPSPISKSAWTAAALKLITALFSPSGLLGKTKTKTFFLQVTKKNNFK
jgi:hypothetical protein